MLTTKRITAKLKSSDSTKVNVNDNDSYLGAGALHGDNRHGARTVGIPGAEGQPGEKGDKGDPGIVWMGEFNSSTLYTYSNAVSFDGSSYIYVNTTDTIGNIPPNPAYWEILAAGTDSVTKDYIDNLLFDKNMKRLVDEDGPYVYIGNAQPGSSLSNSVWSIKRVELKSDGDIDVLWADGVNSYTKVWDDRTNYTYN